MAMVMNVDQMDTRKLVLHKSSETVVNSLNCKEESDDDDGAMAMVITVDQMDTRKLELHESNETVVNSLNCKEESDDDDETLFKPPHGSICSVNENARKRKQCENDSLFKKAVVVLTRLPEYKVSSLRPPTPQQFYSEDESHSSSDSDTQWEPLDSSDSDFSVSEGKQKRAKMTKSFNTAAAAAAAPASPPGNSSNGAAVTPVIISSVFGHSSKELTNARPNAPKVELAVNTVVLARRRQMRWQRGRIVEVVTRDDGRLKYKVSFEEKGKSLVSGHHIAFDTTAKVDQLYVGARVVVQCQDNKFRFLPGVVGELPSRKNRLRFLIFLDDHTPLYAGLPLLHLVWKPLENVASDIPEGSHKDFVEHYLKKWPYPQLTQYRVGQRLNAELNGVLQRCEVQSVDCSLMQVVFEENQHKEWIYRGSLRLEHMAKFLEMKQREEAESDSD